MEDPLNNAENGIVLLINRWHNHLNPKIKKGKISNDEENIIFQGYLKYGNKWSEIAKLIKGRTDNVVKNHFYSSLRKQLNKIKKKAKIDISDKAEDLITSIRNLIKEKQISHEEFDNENIKKLFTELDKIDKPQENLLYFIQNIKT